MQSASLAPSGVLSEFLFAREVGQKRLLRQAMLVICGAAAIAIASKLKIPLWPVPMTMQTFAVLSVGAAFGARLGLLSVLVWLLVGLAGFDVFAASGESGPAYLLGDTGGYLFGFALAALTLGRLAARGWDRTPVKTAAMMAIGNALIYAPGLLWLAIRHGFHAPILQWGLYPFIAGDILKLLLAAALFPLAWRLARKAE
ncbi:MAG: biotin transporter BioY [Parvularculaceae bacterium]